MAIRKVYVGQIESHLEDSIRVYEYRDADGVCCGTETIMEVEFYQPSDREPLVLALVQPILERGLIYK